MYNEEKNIENNGIEIKDQKTEEIRSYVDIRSGLVHQDYSYFFSQNCGDEND